MYYLAAIKLSFASLAEARFLLCLEKQAGLGYKSYLWKTCPAFKGFDARVQSFLSSPYTVY